MILKVIIAVSIIQIVFYAIADWKTLKYGRTIIFTTILIGHFFLLPKLFYPKPEPDGINCGMPILGITLAFWVIGGLTSIIIHTAYSMLFKRRQHTQ